MTAVQRPKVDVETARKNASKRGWLKGNKVCIVGFTGHKDEAPWDDPEFDIRLCNNLWRHVDNRVPDRLYDPHPISEIRKGDPEHLKFLAENGMVPCYVVEQQPDWPTSITLPRSEINECEDFQPFGHYVTNTISWMIAHALYEGPPRELWVVGVDMATGSEYASQRPSCEFWLGLAHQMCDKVYIPQTSDLLKAAVQYGFESDSEVTAKLRHLIQERQQQARQLQGQLQELDQQYTDQKSQLDRQYNAQRLQVVQAIGQCEGAVQQLQYVLGVWHQPQVDRDNPERRDPALERAAAARPPGGVPVAAGSALVGSDGGQEPQEREPVR